MNPVRPQAAALISNSSRKARAFIGDNRAASAVEFALIVPVFFLFAFGLMDFGRLFWTQSVLQKGVDSTVRSAATVQYSGTAAATLRNTCNSRIQSLGLGNYNACAVTVNAGDTSVTVTASQPFSFVAGDMPDLSFSLTGTMSGPLQI